MSAEKKKKYTAAFPGIGKVEISQERAERILWLQKVIRERNQNKNK
ncbi:hypothetical protein [Mangrovibacterium sp.]